MIKPLYCIVIILVFIGYKEVSASPMNKMIPRDSSIPLENLTTGCKDDYIDCSGNGRCSSTNTDSVCICDSGYATKYNSRPLPEPQCTYKRKKQLIAFLLHFFIGSFTGAGEFYIHNVGFGFGQSFLFWGVVVPVVFFICIDSPFMLWCSVTLINAAVTGWWIADVVLFALNDRTDGNGYKLQPW
jgi:hypothetical protein